jgi:hypothetical protein
MDVLPRLAEQDLRRIEMEERAIGVAVRAVLQQHGEIGGFTEVGLNPRLLTDWIATYARQYVRLYAVAYLQLGAPDNIADCLIGQLLDHIELTWFAGVKVARVAALRSLAECAMHDEFKKCHAGCPKPAPPPAARTTETSGPPPSSEQIDAPQGKRREARSGGDYMEAADVAAMLGVTAQWVRDHTTRIEPILPHVRIGRRIRFERTEIERFMRERREHRPTWKRK